MADKFFPTKGNLILAKRSYKISVQGYELLDKKRNILIHELMEQIDKAKEIQKQIEETFGDAYSALQTANMTLGINRVQDIANAIPDVREIDVVFKSVMGVEIPKVKLPEKELDTAYGFFRTNSALDEAYEKFHRALMLTVYLSEIENAVFRLANNIKKTQKRANALKNIMIPKYEKITKFIQNALEEKEREEFTRLKVIKNSKNKYDAYGEKN